MLNVRKLRLNVLQTSCWAQWESWCHRKADPGSNHLQEISPPAQCQYTT